MLSFAGFNIVYSTNETDNEVTSMMFKLESVNKNIKYNTR